MNAETRFVLMTAAMLDDCWAERIKAEIDALPEEFVWNDELHYEETEEYVSYLDDVEFWRHGGA